MKTYITISSVLSLALVANGQVANAPAKFLRNGDSGEFRRRRMTRDAGNDRFLEEEGPSLEAMSMDTTTTTTTSTTTTTTTTTTTPSPAEWESYQLSSDSLLNYFVNEQEGTISMEVVYDGEAWLGIGFSEDGKMIGSDAVM